MDNKNNLSKGKLVNKNFKRPEDILFASMSDFETYFVNLICNEVKIINEDIYENVYNYFKHNDVEWYFLNFHPEKYYRITPSDFDINSEVKDFLDLYIDLNEVEINEKLYRVEDYDDLDLLEEDY